MLKFVAVILIVVVGGGPLLSVGQTVSVDPASPIASLQEAEPNSDQELAALATALMQVRDDTKISFQEYREGVQFFRTTYPEFYGNFFGDPFYATYDARYHELARTAVLTISRKIHPENRFGEHTGFFCPPSDYDPAFGGWCRGTAYAQSDFLVEPNFLTLFSIHRVSSTYFAENREFGRSRHLQRGPDYEHEIEVEQQDGTGSEACTGAEPADCEEGRHSFDQGSRPQPARPEIETINSIDVSSTEIERLSPQERDRLRRRVRNNLDREARAEMAQRYGTQIDVERETRTPETFEERRREVRSASSQRDIGFRSSSREQRQRRIDRFQARNKKARQFQVRTLNGGSPGGESAGGGSSEGSQTRSNPSAAAESSSSSDN